MDNTWASPLYFRALEKGVDLSIQSGTKYIGGHSDRDARHRRCQQGDLEPADGNRLRDGPVRRSRRHVSRLRGLRTMGVRLAQHQASGMKVARWLEARPEVLRVLHPGPRKRIRDTRIWRRDFSGACGLFSVVFKPVPSHRRPRLPRRADSCSASAPPGAAIESLAIPFDCTPMRTANALGAGRPDGALSYRARGRVRPDCRSRTRLCRLRRGRA